MVYASVMIKAFLFFESLFDTPEISFYFKEHKEIDKLTEKILKGKLYRYGNRVDKKNSYLGNVDTKKVNPEVIDN